MQFTVGLKLKGRTAHVIMDAEDALIAALKVKAAQSEATSGAWAVPSADTSSPAQPPTKQSDSLLRQHRLDVRLADHQPAVSRAAS